MTTDAVAERFRPKPAFHTYSFAHITLFIQFVLIGCTSMRGASRIIDIVLSFLELRQPTPSWYSGRLWLLRLGYYKLERPKERAGDWIWIVDHTVQLGKEKCLVILGIRQSRMPQAELYITHEDVEPIALLPVTGSNGEIVYQQLTQAVEKTGVPREIIGDYGTDIKSGIERFCQEHQETCYIYDIKHKTAAILKRELKDDQDWSEFVRLAASTSKRVQQTSLLPLAPPNQRSKARYMNVDKLVKWAQQMLLYMDLGQFETDQLFSSDEIDDKLGWLDGYRDHLMQWEELIQVVKETEEFIKFVGIYSDCHLALKEDPVFSPLTSRATAVRDELLSFIEEQSLNARPGELLLGSSEVIESVFGKFKSLEHDQVKSGFTGMLLSLAAVVSETTQDTIQKALEMVPTKKVQNWYRKNIGQSTQSKRKQVLKIVTSRLKKNRKSPLSFAIGTKKRKMGNTGPVLLSDNVHTGRNSYFETPSIETEQKQDQFSLLCEG